PRLPPTYQPVQLQTGGGGALSAKSAALADWIAAEDASIAPAMRSFFIGPSPRFAAVTPAKGDETLANRRADSCDTSATFQNKTRIGRLDRLTVGGRRRIRNIRRELGSRSANQKGRSEERPFVLAQSVFA